MSFQIFRSCTSILLVFTKLGGAQLPLGNYFLSEMWVLMWFDEFFCVKWIRMKSSCCNLAEQEWRRNWATWWWGWEECKQIRAHLPSWKSLPQQMRLIPLSVEIKPVNEQNFLKWPLHLSFWVYSLRCLKVTWQVWKVTDGNFLSSGNKSFLNSCNLEVQNCWASLKIN